MMYVGDEIQIDPNWLDHEGYLISIYIFSGINTEGIWSITYLFHPKNKPNETIELSLYDLKYIMNVYSKQPTKAKIC